jgi:transcriptional regulator with XRE-family HTH domain
MAPHFRYADANRNRFPENIWLDDVGMPKKLEPAPMTTFGGRLAHWRKQCGFENQGAFAAELGIRQGSLSELETGKSHSPSAHVLLKACELLKLRPRYLWLGEEPASMQHFSELSGPEAQLVMMFRGLPNDAARHALLIDLNAKLAGKPAPVAAQQHGRGPSKAIETKKADLVDKLREGAPIPHHPSFYTPTTKQKKGT